MWRWGLLILLWFTAGFYERLAAVIPFMDVVAIALIVGVPGTLLVDAKIRQRRGVPPPRW